MSKNNRNNTSQQINDTTNITVGVEEQNASTETEEVVTQETSKAEVVENLIEEPVVNDSALDEKTHIEEEAYVEQEHTNDEPVNTQEILDEEIFIQVLAEVKTTHSQSLSELRTRLNNAEIQYMENKNYIMDSNYTTDYQLAIEHKKSLLSKGFRPVIKSVKKKEIFIN